MRRLTVISEILKDHYAEQRFSQRVQDVLSARPDATVTYSTAAGAAYAFLTAFIEWDEHRAAQANEQIAVQK